MGVHVDQGFRSLNAGRNQLLGFLVQTKGLLDLAEVLAAVAGGLEGALRHLLLGLLLLLSVQLPLVVEGVRHVAHVLE